MNLEGRNDQAGRTLVRRVLTDLSLNGQIELRRRRPGGQVRSVFVDWNRLRGESFSRHVRQLFHDLEIDTNDDVKVREIASVCDVRPQTARQWISDDARNISMKHAAGIAGYVRGYGRANMPTHFRNLLISDAVKLAGDSDNEVGGIGAAISAVKKHFSRSRKRLSQDELAGVVLCFVWEFRWLESMVTCQQSGLLGTQSIKVLWRLMPEHLREIRADDAQLLEAFDWIGNRWHRRPGPSNSRLVKRLFAHCEKTVGGKSGG